MMSYIQLCYKKLRMGSANTTCEHTCNNLCVFARARSSTPCNNLPVYVINLTFNIQYRILVKSTVNCVLSGAMSLIMSLYDTRYPT